MRKYRIVQSVVVFFLLFSMISIVNEITLKEYDAKKEIEEYKKPEEKNNGKIRIGITLYSIKNDYMKRFASAAKRYAEENGIEVELYDGNFDASQQNKQVDQMIESGVDGILIVPTDSQVCIEGVESAYDADVPIIAVNTKVNSIKITSYVGSNDVEAGEIIAQNIVTALDGTGNVVILEGPIGQSAQIERQEGVKNVLKKYPDIHIIADKTANWSRLEAQSVMQKWLTTFDRIDAVIAENDDMALGALDALDKAGSCAYVVGIDGMEECVQAVEEGRMLMTLFQDADAQCEMALKQMVSKINGTRIRANYWIPFQEIK